MSGEIHSPAPAPATSVELLAAQRVASPVPLPQNAKQQNDAIRGLAEKMVDECARQKDHERLIARFERTHAVGRSYLGLACGLAVAVFGLCVAEHIGGWPGAGVAALDLAVLTRVFVLGSLRPIQAARR